MRRGHLADNRTVVFPTADPGKDYPLRTSCLRSPGHAIRCALPLLTLGFLPFGPAPLAAQSLTDFHLQWVWTVGGYDVGSAGLEVVDLNGDGRSEILATGDASETGGYWYTLERRGSALVQTASSLPFEDGMIAVSAAQENGHSRVVVTGASSIRVFDGATRGELASFPTWTPSTRAAAAADLDGDGTLDLAVCDYANLYVFELRTGTSQVKYGFGCEEVKIGQTDGDPQLEIVLAGNSAGGFVVDSASLTVDWADVRGFGSHIALGDFDADGRDEVASLIPGDGGVRVQDPETGALFWESSTLTVVALAAADIDAEPGAELVFALGPWAPIYVVDGATATELRIITNSGNNSGAQAIGDADDDGVADILWSTTVNGSVGEVFLLARSDATAYEASSVDWRGPFPGLATGDFRGDGSREVATVTTASSYYYGGIAMILALDDGSLLRSAPQPFPEGFYQFPTSLSSAQLDGDAALEICLGGDIRIGCFDGATFAAQWSLTLPEHVWALRSGEIDGDSFPELLVGTDGHYVYAFDSESGWLQWRTPALGPSWSAAANRIEVADVAGDSQRELIAGSAAWGDGQITTYSGTSGLILAGPQVHPFTSMRAIPGSGPPDVLLVGDENGALSPYDPVTGLEGAPVATFPSAVFSFAAADFNRDGIADYAAATQNHVRIHDGQTGLALWVSPYLMLDPEAGDSLLAGDFDGDSVAEILVATDNGIVKFEAPLLALFADGFESGDTSNW